MLPSPIWRIIGGINSGFPAALQLIEDVREDRGVNI
jgi:hypothetical protein